MNASKEWLNDFAAIKQLFDLPLKKCSKIEKFQNIYNKISILGLSPRKYNYQNVKQVDAETNASICPLNLSIDGAHRT